MFYLGELLVKNPKHRLGNSNGILDILNHTWCRKMKISDVITHKIKPKICPDPFKLHFEKFTPQQQKVMKGNFLN